MRLLSKDHINSLSEHQRKNLIDNIKTSNLTTEEKEANLRLLQVDDDKLTSILKEIENGMADIDDLKD